MNISSIWDSIRGVANDSLNKIIDFLPKSPFTEHIDALSNIPYLPYINWFIPINSFIVIGTSWLAAISIYYIYMIVLRWIKAIE